MEFVMGGLCAVGLALLALCVWSVQVSVTQDRKAAAARERQEQEQRDREAREAQRHQRGVRLRCLGCGYAFRGPMPDTGCPECHLAALVVTEEEYKKEHKNGNKNIQDKAAE